MSPPRGRDKRYHWRAPVPSLSVQPLGGADWAWLVKRLYKLCMDLCNSYIQMHRDLESTLEEAVLVRGGGVGGGGGDHVFLLPHFQSETTTPTSAGGLSARGTPSEEGGSKSQTTDVSTTSPGDTPTPSPGFRYHFLSCDQQDSFGLKNIRKHKDTVKDAVRLASANNANWLVLITNVISSEDVNSPVCTILYV